MTHIILQTVETILHLCPKKDSRNTWCTELLSTIAEVSQASKVVQMSGNQKQEDKHQLETALFISFLCITMLSVAQ
jgi:hypothetical protein